MGDANKSTNPAGTASAHLTLANHLGCTRCDGDSFYVEYKTSNAGAGEGLYFVCRSCGKEILITFLTLGATLNYA